HVGIARGHAVQGRHESFQTKDFIELAREHGVAVVAAADSKYPQIGDITAPFVYARIMGTVEEEKLGYSKTALDQWAARAEEWSESRVPKDINTVGQATKLSVINVFLYVISGAKTRNPHAAMAIAERL